MSGTEPLRPLYVFTAWAETTSPVLSKRQLSDVSCTTGTHFKQRITNHRALFRTSWHKYVPSLKV